MAFTCGPRIRSSDGQPHSTHHWKIDDVVAHVSDLFGRGVFCGHDGCQGFELVVLALVHVVDLEVSRADGNDLRLALGDPTNLEPAEASQGYAHAVMRAEAFDLGAASIRVRDDGDVAVGEHAIDVEQEHANTALGVSSSISPS